NCFSAESLSSQECECLTATDTSILRIEVENEIKFSISIDVFKVTSSMHFDGALRSKSDAQRIDSCGIECRRRQNRDGNDSVPSRIDAVREAVRLNIDHDRASRRPSNRDATRIGYLTIDTIHTSAIHITKSAIFDS